MGQKDDGRPQRKYDNTANKLLSSARLSPQYQKIPRLPRYITVERKGAYHDVSICYEWARTRCGSSSTLAGWPQPSARMPCSLHHCTTPVERPRASAPCSDSATATSQSEPFYFACASGAHMAMTSMILLQRLANAAPSSDRVKGDVLASILHPTERCPLPAQLLSAA